MKKTMTLLLLLLGFNVQAAQYEDVINTMVTDLSEPISQRGGSAIAVLDFSDLQGRTTEFGRFVGEEMSTAIVMSGDGINVIDRANLERILEENKLQRSGLVDPENIKRLGQIIGASSLVIGSYTQLGETIRLTAKVITTDTAQIVAATKGTMELSDEIRGLLNAKIFSSSANGSAASGDSSPQTLEPTKRLTQEGNGYTATLTTAHYSPQESELNVQVEYRNESSESQCLGASATVVPTSITNSGQSLEFKATPGLRLVRETDPKTEEKSYQRARTSMRDFTVVPPGAAQRIVVIFSAENLSSTTTLDVSINLLRGHTEQGEYFYMYPSASDACTRYRSQLPVTYLVFNGVAPTI